MHDYKPQTLNLIEERIESELKTGAVYDLSRLKAGNKRGTQLKNFNEEHYMYSFEKKVGSLFQFRNVLGGYITTLSAIQLNGRIKVIENE